MPGRNGHGILYISYDGMLEPLGQSQVLGYMEHLASERPVYLISYEKPRDWKNLEARAAILQRTEAAHIKWYPLRYHKRLSVLATAWDILVGTALGTMLSLRYHLTIVHARSYVAGVMAMIIKRLTGARFLFDMRGFWVDERVDVDIWRRDSMLFRVAKAFEKRLFLSADHVVSLSHAGVRVLEQFPYMKGHMPRASVIPTCADLERFRPGLRQGDDNFVLGYVGTVGTWYLFEPTLVCFKILRELQPGARLRIINRDEHDFIRDRLSAAQIPSQAVELYAVSHSQMAQEMVQLDAVAFFIRPCFSKQASSPTKLGELLGCGIPCLSNRGVGDMAEILEGEGVGVVVDSFDEPALREGVQHLLSLVQSRGIRERCVEAAGRHYSLAAGVAQYAEIYRTLEAP